MPALPSADNCKGRMRIKIRVHAFLPWESLLATSLRFAAERDDGSSFTHFVFFLKSAAKYTGPSTSVAGVKASSVP